MAQNNSYWVQQGSVPPAGATKKHPNVVQKLVQRPTVSSTYSNEQQQKT